MEVVKVKGVMEVIESVHPLTSITPSPSHSDLRASVLIFVRSLSRFRSFALSRSLLSIGFQSQRSGYGAMKYHSWLVSTPRVSRKVRRTSFRPWRRSSSGR
jgi:hypothetical protein